MTKINISIAQFDILWENPEANIHKINNLINNNQVGDVLVLPEMFTTGFLMNPTIELANKNNFSLEWMKQIAIKKNIVVCGSLIVYENKSFFNRFFWVQPDSQIFTYDKKHLFSPGNENLTYTSGNNKAIINYKNFKFSLLICYDLRFPVWIQNNFNHITGFDYDVLIFVANWPAKRINHWRQLLIARAIENQAYVVGVNRIGNDKNYIEYNGNSLVVDPLGNILFEDLSNSEFIHSIELDYSIIENWRNLFKVSYDWDKFSFI